MNHIKKLIFFFLILLGISGFSHPKTPVGWITKTTGAGEENCSGVVTDAEGNVYAIFRYNGLRGTAIHAANGAFEIVGNPENYGGSNTLLCSYAPNGDLRWATKLEGIGTVAAWSMAIGQDNNLYLSGNFNRNAIFHSTDGKVEEVQARQTDHQEKYFYQFFTAKYNLLGGLEWLKHGHSQDNMVDFKSVTDKSGNCYSYVHSAGQNVMIDDFILTFSAVSPRFTEHYNVIVPKVNAKGTTEWCFIGGKNSPLYHAQINEKQALELIFYIDSARNYFFNTNGWDTLFNAPNEKAGYAKITLTNDGKIAAVLPVFEVIKNGRLKDVVTLSSGYCAVFENQNYPGQYSSRRLIILGSDSIKGTTENDLFVVFFNEENKVTNYYRIDGYRDQKFNALHVSKSGDVYVGSLVSPNSIFADKTSQLETLTNENSYSYFVFCFSDIGAYKNKFFAGNYGYSGYEKHLHIASFEDYVAIGVELGLASTIAGISETIDGYKESNGTKITTTDAALIYVQNKEKINVGIDVNVLVHKTFQLVSALTFLQQSIATVKSVADTLVSQLKLPVVPKPDAEPTLSNESEVQSQVFLFPNPVNRTNSTITLRISGMESRKITWSLVSSSGIQSDTGILQVDAADFEAQLQFSALSVGLYFLRIQVENELIVKRFVVF